MSTIRRRRRPTAVKPLYRYGFQRSQTGGYWDEPDEWTLYTDEGCSRCGCCSTDWEECDQCGGEGEIDVYDSDPLWYDPGDTEPCEQCQGKGGCGRCVSAAVTNTASMPQSEKEHQHEHRPRAGDL